MHIVTTKDSEELSKIFAEWLIADIAESLLTQDRYTVALSGGSTPRKLFAMLATEPYSSRIDWPKLHFFWGDERFVPFSDSRNNARMAFDELLDKVPVQQAQIHPMPTSLAPEEAVASYEQLLHEYFNGQPHTFNLVMLGLGDNSHTLSLFPGYAIVHENTKWVDAFYLEEQSMYRITLTRKVVNMAAKVAYLVSGADKASAVKAVIEGPANADVHPAQVIQPISNGLYWFLDEAAAARLQQKSTSE